MFSVCGISIVNHLVSWWRHQMETISPLLAICAGNSPVTGEVPTQRPVSRSFDVFFDYCLNKWLSKQSWDWWFETPLRSLWRHYNVLIGGDNGIAFMDATTLISRFNNYKLLEALLNVDHIVAMDVLVLKQYVIHINDINSNSIQIQIQNRLLSHNQYIHMFNRYMHCHLINVVIFNLNILIYIYMYIFLANYDYFSNFVLWNSIKLYNK